MENASARNLWGDFLDAHLEFVNEDAPKVGHFCDNEKDANTCANLVCKDIKGPPHIHCWAYNCGARPCPRLATFVVTDWSGKAKCIIRTTSVKLIPFFAVHAEHARLEGEGDKSLEHWRKTHWDYYTRELDEFGRKPLESMIIVFERFEKVFQR